MSDTGARIDTERARALMPFAAVLGLEIVSAEPARVEARASWSPERCTAGGALHGGFLIAVVDSTAAVCASLNLPPGAGTSTIESKTNFFGSVRGGDISVVAEPVHVGRTTIVVQTDVTDESGRRISRSLQTQAVLQPRT